MVIDPFVFLKNDIDYVILTVQNPVLAGSPSLIDENE